MQSFVKFRYVAVSADDDDIACSTSLKMSSEEATFAPRILTNLCLLQSVSFTFLADTLVFSGMAPYALLVRTDVLEQESILTGASLGSIVTLV